MNTANSASPRPALSLLTVVRVAGGIALLAVGLLLAIPGVPGPGIPLMLLGLVLLSNHFIWAKKTLLWIKRELRKMRRRI